VKVVYRISNVHLRTSHAMVMMLC